VYRCDAINYITFKFSDFKSLHTVNAKTNCIMCGSTLIIHDHYSYNGATCVGHFVSIDFARIIKIYILQNGGL